MIDFYFKYKKNHPKRMEEILTQVGKKKYLFSIKETMFLRQQIRKYRKLKPIQGLNEKNENT